VDAHTFEIRAVYPTGPRPNGVALNTDRQIAAVATIGDESRDPSCWWSASATTGAGCYRCQGDPDGA
jgi:hypothetical protein